MPSGSPLQEKLKVCIRAQGPLTIADYMTICLHDPEHGYYRSGNPIGAEGDFVTAPEISQMFGELIGLWCVHVWLSMGSPAPFRLIELGPGRGTLMADALRAAKVVPEFLAASEIHLVESSDTLRSTQQRTLARCGPRLNWHQNLMEIPAGPAIVLANEFVDALPVRQFVSRGDRWFERQVGLDNVEQLCMIEKEVSDKDAELVPEPIRLSAAEGAVAEVRPEVRDLLAALVDRSLDYPLAALILDYGYGDGSTRYTFQAVRRHRYADPLIDPGEADLTALVDFAGLRSAAADSGLNAWGPIGQGAFLIGLGLNERLQRLLAAANQRQQLDLVSGAERLVAPDQMGELFKVLALASPGLSTPPPFEDASKDEADEA